MITLTPPNTLRVIGTYGTDSGKLTGVEFEAYFATREEAASFAARFPKSVRASSASLSGAPGVTGVAMITLRFSPTKATGAKNDASIARYAAVLRAIKKLGIQLVDAPHIFTNQFHDFAAIDRAVSELAKTPPAQLDREIAEALRGKRGN